MVFIFIFKGFWCLGVVFCFWCLVFFFFWCLDFFRFLVLIGRFCFFCSRWFGGFRVLFCFFFCLVWAFWAEGVGSGEGFEGMFVGGVFCLV